MKLFTRLVQRWIAKKQPQPVFQTVAEAMHYHHEQLGTRIYRTVMRAYYIGTDPDWGAPIQDDSFERFVEVLKAFPPDLHDKHIWVTSNSPWYGNTPPPLYDEMHALLMTRGCGPGTIKTLQHLFIYLPTT